MHTWARILIAMGGALALGGCDELEEQWLKLRHANTAYIVAACAERNQAAAKRLELDVRAYCARQHSVRIEVKHDRLSTGGIDCVWTGPFATAEASSFTADVYNQTGHIITQVSVALTRKAEDGQTSRISFSSYSDTWIEPGKARAVTMTLPSKVKCSDFRNTDNPARWGWQYSGVFGVKPELR